MIATLTPEQAASNAQAWATAIVAICGTFIAAASAIYMAWQKSGLSAKLDALVAKSNIHDSQIKVNNQNIIATALATPSPVNLVAMPEAKPEPVGSAQNPLQNIIPSQSAATQQPTKP